MSIKIHLCALCAFEACSCSTVTWIDKKKKRESKKEWKKLINLLKNRLGVTALFALKKLFLAIRRITVVRMQSASTMIPPMDILVCATHTLSAMDIHVFQKVHINAFLFHLYYLAQSSPGILPQGSRYWFLISSFFSYSLHWQLSSWLSQLQYVQQLPSLCTMRLRTKNWPLSMRLLSGHRRQWTKLQTVAWVDEK